MKKIFLISSAILLITLTFGQSTHYELNYNKGTQAANAGKYQDAISFYTLSIDEHPAADAYFDRASVYNILSDSCNFCKDLYYASELGDNEAMNLYHFKCTRTLVIHKIPDSLKVKYPKIKLLKFNYSTCNPTYFREITFLDSNKTEITETTVYRPDTVFSDISILPQYIGGEKARNRFLAENIKYPEVAKSLRIQGTVYLSFIVNENGDVSDIKVIRGIGGGCDEEAIRVIKLMSKWKPATQNGKNVRVIFNMTIDFRIG
jgi:TonB family protein